VGSVVAPGDVSVNNRIEKTKVVVDTAQTVLEIILAVLDRRQTKKDQEKKIKELEAEIERLKKEKK
jgi:hypothetical protein